MNKLVVFLLFVLCSLHSITTAAQEVTPDSESTSCISYIPRAISPNGDGINDYFFIEPSCDLVGYSLKIFDEYSQLLHESENVELGWDGSFQGDPLPEGHYIWVLSYEDLNTGTKISQKGDLVLVK